MVLKVKKIKKETKDTYSIIFEKPKNFTFYPGQYLDIALPVKDPTGKTRIMSIASSPSENFLMITYKVGFTPYKKYMKQLKAGDQVESSHPAGTVVIDDSAPIVMLAGGIGIAPHRSMIKWAVDRKLNLPITLIYSNSNSDFIYKKELDSWLKVYPKLTIHYVITSQEGRLTKEQLNKILVPSSTDLVPVHYLAGPPAMVDDFENILLKMGVESFNIRTDRFDGY
ncbi:MAG: oxidoreductase, 2Fe-2S and FAD/NAD(P) binding domain-containing protein [Microgenomates group bacterium Gr01-1014_80]|nr:MAG: oxidoreductase, 2Fe-2S and FAD/NAD(P) binding domain-containing protein [Microgenomates group bacterium Gr01-1014_80]